ncbi:MAG TPA: PqqD family protein [Ramlibacter sp.]|uniref:PqqD family protein n=1 Tax=Ramlibacter sp. TaxID=1917967 RepID=UPI002D80F15B|nr:PqqD family protein [Ramlibacter sp.]HET8746390.1 PqqD family protein [Ramlibacter sp.]
MGKNKAATAGKHPHPIGGGHRLSGLRFYPGGFVLDKASGLFYRLTPVADYLLRQYDAGTEVREFVELVESRYGLDHASAVRDVELLLNQFAGPGLLRVPRAEALA